MKVINICDSDWANFAYDNMIALRSVGIDCTGAKLQDHAFGYTNTLPKIWLQEMKLMVADCDVIQFFHDNTHLFRELLPYMKGKKVIAYHTSSYYRKNYDIVNSAMNPVVYRSVNAMPEFMAKGAKNEVYMVGAVDTAYLEPTQYHTGPGLKFAHYPSSDRVKGTAKIKELMGAFQLPDCTFSCDIENVNYTKQLFRMSECDVYIEMFTDKDGNGMPYGNFGITALEAAALGKLVITNCKGILFYMQSYGKPFFYITDDEVQFNFVIETMAKQKPEKIAELQRQKRDMVHQRHGYQATGEYFLKHVL